MITPLNTLKDDAFFIHKGQKLPFCSDLLSAYSATYKHLHDSEKYNVDLHHDEIPENIIKTFILASQGKCFDILSYYYGPLFILATEWKVDGLHDFLQQRIVEESDINKYLIYASLDIEKFPKLKEVIPEELRGNVEEKLAQCMYDIVYNDKLKLFIKLIPINTLCKVFQIWLEKYYDNITPPGMDNMFEFVLNEYKTDPKFCLLFQFIKSEDLSFTCIERLLKFKNLKNQLYHPFDYIKFPAVLIQQLRSEITD